MDPNQQSQGVAWATHKAILALTSPLIDCGVHHADLAPDGTLARNDELIATTGEPSHDDLCQLEQEWFLEAIQGRADVDGHLRSVVESLRIVLAADESIRTGQVVEL